MFHVFKHVFITVLVLPNFNVLSRFLWVSFNNFDNELFLRTATVDILLTYFLQQLFLDFVWVFERSSFETKIWLVDFLFELLSFKYFFQISPFVNGLHIFEVTLLNQQFALIWQSSWCCFLRLHKSWCFTCKHMSHWIRLLFFATNFFFHSFSLRLFFHLYFDQPFWRFRNLWCLVRLTLHQINTKVVP